MVILLLRVLETRFQTKYRTSSTIFNKLSFEALIYNLNTDRCRNNLYSPYDIINRYRNANFSESLFYNDCRINDLYDLSSQGNIIDLRINDLFK